MALLIALPVHGLTLMLFIPLMFLLGLVITSAMSGAIGSTICPGILALVLGLGINTLRPRVGKWPKDVLERENYPALYGLADTISRALGARPVDGIVFSKDYNASFQHIGLQRRSLITFGLPLWTVLNSEEQTAVLAHELSHDVNGDPARSLVVGSAYWALVRWTAALETQLQENPSLGLVMLPALMVTAFGAAIMRRLITHDSRYAEYYADLLAAQVSGTDAMVSALTKTGFAADFYLYLQSYARYADSTWNQLIKIHRENIARKLADPAEVEKIMREYEQPTIVELWTHPPLGFRKCFLESRRVDVPKVTVSADEAAQIEKELIWQKEDLQKPIRGDNEEEKVDSWRRGRPQ